MDVIILQSCFICLFFSIVYNLIISYDLLYTKLGTNITILNKKLISGKDKTLFIKVQALDLTAH